MTDDVGEVVFDYGSTGQRLTVRVLGLYAPNAVDLVAREWVTAVVEVDAHPFHGAFETVLTPADREEWTGALHAFASGLDRCHVGGGRGPDILLERAGDVVRVTATPSGDDPWPTLTYLIFGASE